MGYSIGMRLAVTVLSLAISGCQPAGPVDCALARQEFGRCFAQTAGMADRPRLLKCIPYSRSLRMTGTWATTWEYNEFFEGRTVSPEQAFSSPRHSTYLAVDGTPLQQEERGEGQAALFALEFIGRRPLCTIYDDYRVVIVDRLISEKAVQRWGHPTP